MTGDWCRTDITGPAPAVALLAARVSAMRLQVMRGAIWPDLDTTRELLVWLLVGPDDLVDVVEFQGVPVMRVEHWQGEPVLALPAGFNVASAYQVARALETIGVRAEDIRAFGPPGWEHVSVPLVRGKQQHRVDFVPVTGLAGPMIGVELT